ncbi:Dolichyl-phosphate-mannose-protein mannosyltransferase [Candidatus Fervidibacteria bacterium JGI MDM2 JNZ-1-D12]
MRWDNQRLFWLLVIVAVVVRLLVAVLPGNRLEPPWSGGGDSQHYATLAQNLLEGRGFTYNGQPTAFRPPLYPFLLAAMMALFGDHYPFATRLLQFLLSLAIALLAALTAREIFGQRAFRPALLLCLYCPTLVYAVGQIGTETLAAFFIAFSLYGFICLLKSQSSRHVFGWASLSGFAVGLAALTRFSAPAILPTGIYAAFVSRHREAIFALVTAFSVTLSPWLIRNKIAFGTWTYSTFGSFNMVRGILDPQGRSRGDTEVKAVLGWTHQEYERNDRDRSFPSELEMDRQCRQVYWRLMREHGWSLISLHLKKLTWFWLSTDQLLDPGGRGVNGLLRRLMAAIWWFWLVLAWIGLIYLWRDPVRRPFAYFVLCWIVLGTIAHLPFCTNTRLRASIMDTIVSALAGGGWVAWHQGGKGNGEV